MAAMTELRSQVVSGEFMQTLTRTLRANVKETRRSQRIESTRTGADCAAPEDDKDLDKDCHAEVSACCSESRSARTSVSPSARIASGSSAAPTPSNSLHKNVKVEENSGGDTVVAGD